MMSRSRLILKSLSVGLLTWLGAVLAGSLLYIGSTTISALIETSDFSGFGSAAITIFVMVLWAALISLVVMFPFNFLILLAATRMPNHMSTTLRHFFLLSANILVTPAVLAISPFVRPSILHSISQLSLVTILLVGLILISLIAVKRGYKASLITLMLLGTVMFFVFFFLSAPHELTSPTFWTDTWIYLCYQLPCLILLSVLTHRFNLLNT